MIAHPLRNETLNTANRNEIVDLTPRVQMQVQVNNVTSGMVVVTCPHTTAGVTVNENFDPDVKKDMLAKLEQLIPHLETYYEHDEGNSDAHLKTALVGNSVTLLVEGGKLLLGRWQGVYFCEFDGPRERRVQIKVVDFSPRND